MLSLLQTIATRLVLLDRFFRLSLPAIITIAAAAPDPQQQQEQWAAAVDKRDAAALFYPQPVAKQACMAFAEVRGGLLWRGQRDCLLRMSAVVVAGVH